MPGQLAMKGFRLQSGSPLTGQCYILRIYKCICVQYPTFAGNLWGNKRPARSERAYIRGFLSAVGGLEGNPGSHIYTRVCEDIFLCVFCRIYGRTGRPNLSVIRN